MIDKDAEHTSLPGNPSFSAQTRAVMFSNVSKRKNGISFFMNVSYAAVAIFFNVKCCVKPPSKPALQCMVMSFP
ncbi:hypothetical protein DPMN_084239 [Dreissena polymorpha]|uniref:Uncharacterized protein n=1 Tax=Dreissena polymorpha TaxID=45954 RepID=A0A9D3YA70_DREPO|nr:hypothetical protein DPMN_084239 [Dreissena polymorpha]